MSNADFQTRLQRISANAPQQQSIARDTPHKGQPRAQKPNYGLLALGGAVMVLGLQAVKYTNANYDAIRDSIGLGGAAGLGIATYAIFLTGIVVMARAVFKRRAAQPMRKVSNRAKLLSSLFGFTLGTIACLLMFMTAAAKFVETEPAQLFSAGGALIAFLLLLLSILFGLVGLFFRRHALRRVPVYFFLGGGLTFATVRIAGINMLKWPQFIAMLQ